MVHWVLYHHLRELQLLGMPVVLRSFFEDKGFWVRSLQYLLLHFHCFFEVIRVWVYLISWVSQIFSLILVFHCKLSDVVDCASVEELRPPVSSRLLELRLKNIGWLVRVLRFPDKSLWCLWPLLLKLLVSSFDIMLKVILLLNNVEPVCLHRHPLLLVTEHLGVRPLAVPVRLLIRRFG